MEAACVLLETEAKAGTEVADEGELGADSVVTGRGWELENPASLLTQFDIQLISVTNVSIKIRGVLSYKYQKKK